MRVTAWALTALFLPGSVLAQDAAAPGAPTGDAAAGEGHFQQQCISCHVVEDEAGEVLAGRNARVGPNLYGVVGRVAGGLEDYDYSDLLKAYGEDGAVWEEENFVGFVQDPTGFLREATGEDGRSKMAYQVRDEQEAHDLYAYLATFSPEAAEGQGGEAEAEGEGTAEEGETAEEDASE